ncbi:MAG: hypothetical protein E7345_01320 [Clostridiales bacterium]|nr:hypothetical protein [Clostridiales bacterium]
MKKKLFSFIACIGLIFAFGVVLFRGNINTNVALAASSEQVVVLAESNNEDSIETTEENPTFFGRIWEYVKSNYPEIITTITAAGVFLLTTVLPKYLKKRIKNLDDKMLTNNSTQAEVIDVINLLIESYNKLEAKIDKYNKGEEDRNKAVSDTVKECRAILEILATVYANSKNLPQGVKDLVNLKYANVLKAIEENKPIEDTLVEEKAEDNSQEKTEV